TMYREAAPNLRGGATAIGRVAAMPDGSASVGLTLLSQHTALLDCEQTLRSAQSLEMRYLTEDRRQRLTDICADMAGNILARSPADSFAWLVAALAAAQRGDNDAFNQAFIRSYDNGRHEGWLANMRVTAAESHLEALLPAAMALHEQDIKLVA